MEEIIVPLGQKERFCKILSDEYPVIIRESSRQSQQQEELSILLNIAKGYELGIGLQKSLPQALVTYMKAAEKGCADAAYHLGEWYRDGKNVPQDEPKALDYFQQAAKSGFAKAAEQVNALKQSIAARKEEE